MTTPSLGGAPVHSIDLSPLLAEGGGATAAIPSFDVQATRGDAEFRGTASLRVSRTNRGVRIWGSVRGSQTGVCARCLAPVTVALTADLDDEAVDERHVDDAESLRIGAGNSVDAGRLAIEALDLARHLVLRCDPPCPERCGSCGAAHATEACPNCEIDPRLVGLAALLPAEGDDDAEIG